MTGTAPVDPREPKLPVWARDIIADLRYELGRARSDAEAARLLTSPDESDTVVQAPGGLPIGLGNGPTVTFRLPTFTAGWEREIRVRVEGDRLDVMSVGGGIDVRPRSGNVVTLGMVARKAEGDGR